ncbi:Fibrillarin-like rRNA/tRNA 2'-O-methyltransferase [Candidatus Bilamarchaeum dharawalense]|uniref:Fibrillarin-like rRNA/tRNA 2'-O-methyltransferase n=1 Tax=Candidatus Bilamarchaeum dharawalense TaxID=2885759 RepID=A0A5E4LMQ4_9ARCH|nr:Fibrillarin-like rRNA/tRNA 2'-O-methyltransferase [Candidatus Bilamarchaeum dharawalense]
MQEIFPGVFQSDRLILTINADPGRRVYNEKFIKEGGKEYRIWDPFRSKLCAAIRNGLKNFPFTPGSKLLYLGASTGTTISHLSDVMGETGEIYSVEISSHCLRSLIALSDRRNNIIPIQGDARQPQEYADVGKVDSLYQDVAQPDQDVLLIKNAQMFLKKDGIAMICIKSQSIDVTKEPKTVFEEVLKSLEKEFDVLEKIKIEPFDKDHLFVVLKYRG